jgi:glyoxylase-like metal-dependent hydrolase (beta-lactamase superfamily II)
MDARKRAYGAMRVMHYAPHSVRGITDGESMSDDTHEIYAIRYGHHDRKSSENFIGGDPHDVLQPLDFYVWAIVGPSGPIILDTGFDAAMGKKRQRELIKPVGEGLKAIGVEPAEVRTVIVSHMHYDHVGNYDLFPRARYHLQDREMAYATGRCMCHTALRMPFELEDVVAMVRKVFADRVAFHDGEDEIVPGVTVHHIGGHSKGLQSVRVKTRRGPVVLAADAAHLYAHVETGRIFPITYNVAEVVEGYARLKKLAASPQHVVPGHDPLVLARYPAAKAGLEGWVVRLDAEPRA